MATNISSVTKGRTINLILKAFKQLNPKNVEMEAKRPVRVAVVGSPEQMQEVAAFLLGPDPDAYVRAAESLLLLAAPLVTDALPLLLKCDIVLMAKDMEQSLSGVSQSRIFRFTGKDDLQWVVRDILHSSTLDYAHLPLARMFPAFRQEVSVETIQRISIENALFVVSTSLGNIIPNPLQPLTSLAEAMGDLIVLTANQIRLLFMLAAANNKELTYKSLSPEIVTIMGAAFGWRTISRNLVDKIPFGGGILPKAAIAFAGTWAIGDGVAYYYTTGQRLTREQLKERFDMAYERGRVTLDAIVSKMKNAYMKQAATEEEKPGELPE